MRKNILFVLGLALALSACGKGDSAPVQSSAGAAATGPNPGQYPNQYFAPISGEYGGFYVSYRFTQNGCGTGFKEFFSYSDQQTRDQLCSALQDNGYNRYCAVDIRQAYFNSMCSGKTWTPQ
jgi:hypothetical protein